MASLTLAGSISPAELVEDHLRRISPEVNAFVTVRAEAIHDDPPRGPLYGVPLTIKDSFDVAGLPAQCGSRLRPATPAREDATAVGRLRAAGAIILGKTNTPEMLASYETDNFITGRTKNPWDLERTPGGSSGGEAAAIASGCSAGGLGSDGGGSIRVPAHFCGIAGLKPTPGRISAAGHFPEISYPAGLLGVAGPMARTAADLKLMFGVLAGYDFRDPFSAPVPVRWPEFGNARVAGDVHVPGAIKPCIGYFEDDGRTPVTQETRNAIKHA